MPRGDRKGRAPHPLRRRPRAAEHRLVPLGPHRIPLGVKTNPEEIHACCAIVTDFLVDWIGLQAETFDSIDGIFLLDDLIGFLRDDDFRQFALPYLKQVFDARAVSVRFLHNDAAGLVTARHLAAMGVNLFNFSFNHASTEMRQLAGRRWPCWATSRRATCWPPARRTTSAAAWPTCSARWTTAAASSSPAAEACRRECPSENMDAMCDAAL